MASTEFINLYEKLSKLHEDSADSNKYVSTAYAIFEYADEDSWDVLWVGEDEGDAWDEWDRTCKWSDEYRGPNYPVYLVEYTEDQENPLTVDEFNELVSLVKMSNVDDDLIIDYFNMGYNMDEYRAEEEVDEDDYGEYDYDTEYNSDEEDDYYEEEDDYYAGMED